jgi:hypothetical protein
MKRIALPWKLVQDELRHYHTRSTSDVLGKWFLGVVYVYPGMWESQVWNYDLSAWGPCIKHKSLDDAKTSVDKKLVELGWTPLDEHMLVLL